MKNLAELQAECSALGIEVENKGRPSKEPYILALRDHHWQQEHPGKPHPPQLRPMLLGSFHDLSEDEARQIEDDFQWIIQPKMDGVRALLHVEHGQIRITGRCVSEVTYRLSEFQDHLPHLAQGLAKLEETILDGELVCPASVIDTGTTTTTSSLQATTAILATTPEKALRIQIEQHAAIQFHAFDILLHRGEDVTSLPLIERQELLVKSIQAADNAALVLVPTFVVGKAEIHRRVIAAGGEGTVLKKVDAPYQPGRRVEHWLKRKREIEVEVFVTGFKKGNNGHANLVGAVEFSVRQADGSIIPAGWVSALLDSERRAMTEIDGDGEARLAPRCLGKRAVIAGQEFSARSKRIRHARLVRWIDQVGV